MTIRNSVKEIEEEIKEIEGATPDKKAEYNKLEGLLDEKKTSLKAYIESKKDRDLLEVATSLLKDLSLIHI